MPTRSWIIPIFIYTTLLITFSFLTSTYAFTILSPSDESLGVLTTSITPISYDSKFLSLLLFSEDDFFSENDGLHFTVTFNYTNITPSRTNSGIQIDVFSPTHDRPVETDPHDSFVVNPENEVRKGSFSTVFTWPSFSSLHQSKVLQISFTFDPISTSISSLSFAAKITSEATGRSARVYVKNGADDEPEEEVFRYQILNSFAEKFYSNTNLDLLSSRQSLSSPVLPSPQDGNKDIVVKDGEDRDLKGLNDDLLALVMDFDRLTIDFTSLSSLTVYDSYGGRFVIKTGGDDNNNEKNSEENNNDKSSIPSTSTTNNDAIAQELTYFDLDPQDIVPEVDFSPTNLKDGQETTCRLNHIDNVIVELLPDGMFFLNITQLPHQQLYQLSTQVNDNNHLTISCATMRVLPVAYHHSINLIATATLIRKKNEINHFNNNNNNHHHNNINNNDEPDQDEDETITFTSTSFAPGTDRINSSKSSFSFMLLIIIILLVGSGCAGAVYLFLRFVVWRRKDPKTMLLRPILAPGNGAVNYNSVHNNSSNNYIHFSPQHQQQFQQQQQIQHNHQQQNQQNQQQIHIQLKPGQHQQLFIQNGIVNADAVNNYRGR